MIRVGEILPLGVNLDIIMTVSSLPSGKDSLITFYLSSPKLLPGNRIKIRPGEAVIIDVSVCL